MTDDLIKRLRDSFIYDQQHYAPDPLVAEAADHIETLTAEVERLRNAMVVMDNTVRELTEATHMAMLELGSHGACPACFNAHSSLRNALTEPEGLK